MLGYGKDAMSAAPPGNGRDTEALRAFIKALEPRARLIFLLHYADDLSVSEIAAVLRIPGRTVTEVIGRVRQHAGRIVGAPLAPTPRPIGVASPDL